MAGVFVGRRAELSALHAALADARSGRARAVTVEGAAGAGKTWLVRRFSSEAGGAVVIRAGGDEAELGLQYGVLRQLWDVMSTAPVVHDADPRRTGDVFARDLRELARAGPVVAVVDDVHWADSPSVQALGSALTRLATDPVLLLVAGRTIPTMEFPTTHVALGGLSAEELADLSAELGLDALPLWAARRLREHTSGNPRVAVALLREVGPRTLSRLGSDVLPAPREVRSAVGERLAALAPETRDFVGAGAVLGNDWDLGLAGEVAGTSDPDGAAREAIARGVLRRTSGNGASLAFRSAVERAAVYHSIGAARRAEHHQRAAARVVPPDEALRHLAAALPGADAEVAERLEAHADAGARSGTWRAAADDHLLAARLTPPGADHDRRLIAAFDALVAAGDLSMAGSVADEVEWVEPLRHYVRGVQAWFEGRGGDALRFLTREDLGGRGDRRVALLRVLSGEGVPAEEWTGGVAPDDPRAPYDVRVIGLIRRSDAHYRHGAWDDAAADGEHAVAEATEGGFGLILAEAHTVASFPASATGDHSRAEEHVRAAACAAATVGTVSARLHAAMAAARLAQAAGDAESQSGAFSDFDSRWDEMAQPWRELLAEALVRLGRLDEAGEVLLPLGDAESGAARVRGLLAAARGDIHGSHAAFEASIVAADDAGMPFARAQAELAYGATLRRQGRRRAAVAYLEAARSRFSVLGARPFADRCANEIAGCGLAPVPRGTAPPERLTPAERAVAGLVAAGRTNREAAAELTLSVKTVEYHLRNVFTKLGIRSRAQLAARLAER